MKDFRAIYRTETHPVVKYDFMAKDDDHAIKFANIKFAPETQPTLRLFQGEREVPYTYDTHEEMSISEKERFVKAKYVR